MSHPQKNRAEVVIIGGGIIGVSTAFHLAQKGQKDVLLFERDLLAQASTGLSVGGIRQQFSHPANILLSRESLRFLKEFKKKYGKNTGLHQEGYLFLAQKEKTWKEFLRNVDLQRQHHVPVEVLSSKDIKDRWPYIQVDDLKGGTFCGEDGYADPYSVAAAMAQKAKLWGVHIQEKTKVTGIRVQKGKVKGVDIPSGFISVPVVVNAAGAWGTRVAQTMGIDLPVQPYRRQVFQTRPVDFLPKPVPMVLDFDVSFYFRGEGPGLLMGMSDPHEPPGFHTHVDWNFLERVVDKAVTRVSLLERAQIMKGWAGLYAVTPDHNPIIGPIPEIEGFFCATGFSGHGFQHGPAVGRILSELVVEGQSSFDLSPFAFHRFDEIKEKGETRVV